MYWPIWQYRVMTRSLPTSRIHDSLDTALARKRVAFWFDPEAEWSSEFESYAPSGMEKRQVNGNEFSLKVEIRSERMP